MELGDLLDSVRKLAQILGWHQDICGLIQDEEQKVSREHPKKLLQSKMKSP